MDLFLDGKTFENLKKMATQSNADLENDIYYRRELLINSLEGRRIDLLTISSFHNICNACESRMDDMFPDQIAKRCQKFENKKVRYDCVAYGDNVWGVLLMHNNMCVIMICR